ncbi:DUF2884 family protein [Microbulbifer sp. SAOS-129_SWC]|uniref:DUF2884 family protein n=1 Tax=Microbulbifer sp. SAOS-129_SWC TaxID=3145235 RepID=UPI00321688A8
MWKPLAIAAALVASGPALAHGINLNIDSDSECSADLHYQLRVGPDSMAAYQEDGSKKPLFAFLAPDQLVVDGKVVPLNAEQQALVQRYRGQLHVAGRQLTDISMDAVELALQGVNIALATLAGADHEDTLEVEQMSAEIHRRAEQRFRGKDEIYTLGDPQIDDFIEETVDKDLEPRIEKLAMKSAGNIAWFALKAALTGGASIDSQAEAAAQKVEEKMEAKGKVLEKNVQGLCTQLQAVDATEREIHTAIPALAPYDIVEMNPDRDSADE